MSVEAVGRYTGELYSAPTGNSEKCEADAGIGWEDRSYVLPIFSRWQCTNNLQLLAALAAHLDSEGVEFMQFAFRWMNCLLMREISVKNTIRMWDTYLVRFSCQIGGTVTDHIGTQAEGPDAFSQFHLYVCCAFLVRWSDKLRQMDFQVRTSQSVRR